MTRLYGPVASYQEGCTPWDDAARDVQRRRRRQDETTRVRQERIDQLEETSTALAESLTGLVSSIRRYTT